MTVSLSLLAGAGWQFFDDNGTPLTGGLLYTYEAGTTTPLTTYTDSNGNVANSNPIVLDAAGRVPYQVWLTSSASYKFILKTSTGVTVWTEDDVFGGVLSADVLFAQSGIGAVTRTAQDKMRDVFSFEDFGAAGNNSTDDTAAIQAAIDAVAARPAGLGLVTGKPGAQYKITGTLLLRSGVQIDLCGSTIIQYTSNTPIISAPISSSIQNWSLSNGVLRFATQQTASDTSAYGIRLANGALSYNWTIDSVSVVKARIGLFCPNTSGTFAFVGQIQNFVANDCAEWAIYLDCDSGFGANTNLVFNNCWALQTAGAEQPSSKGFYFNACVMSQWQSLFADHIQGQFLFAQTCTGWFGVLTAESTDVEVGPNALTSVVSFANVDASVEVLKFIGNNFKTYNSFVANVTGSIAVGNTITGATSGATGTVRTISGSGPGTTITYYMTNGTIFSAGENILVAGVSQGTVTTATSQTGNIYIFRGIAATYDRPFTTIINNYITESNTYTGQNIYDVVPTSNIPATSGFCWIYNWSAKTDRSVVLADSATPPKSIRYWNGDNRYYTLGMTADAAWDGNVTNYVASEMNASNSFSGYSPTALDRQLRFKSTAPGFNRDGGLTLYGVDGSGNEIWRTKALRLRTDAVGEPRLSLVAPSDANGSWEILTSSASNVETRRLAGTKTGSILAGAPAALATNASDGFLYVPTCAGTPTGAPTAQTGLVPIVVDTTNNKLYFYSGGAWRDAGP